MYLVMFCALTDWYVDFPFRFLSMFISFWFFSIQQARSEFPSDTRKSTRFHDGCSIKEWSSEYTQEVESSDNKSQSDLSGSEINIQAIILGELKWDTSFGDSDDFDRDFAEVFIHLMFSFESIAFVNTGCTHFFGQVLLLANSRELGRRDESLFTTSVNQLGLDSIHCSSTNEQFRVLNHPSLSSTLHLYLKNSQLKIWRFLFSLK